MVDVPPPVPVVVTVTSTEPAVPAGAVAVSVVGDDTVTAVATVVPNCTDVVPTENPVPVTLTLVPPTSGPMSGEIAATVGTVSAAAGAAVTTPKDPRATRATNGTTRRGNAMTRLYRRSWRAPMSSVRRCGMSPTALPPNRPLHRTPFDAPHPTVARRGSDRIDARDP